MTSQLPVSVVRWSLVSEWRQPCYTSTVSLYASDVTATGFCCYISFVDGRRWHVDCHLAVINKTFHSSVTRLFFGGIIVLIEITSQSMFYLLVNGSNVLCQVMIAWLIRVATASSHRYYLLFVAVVSGHLLFHTADDALVTLTICVCCMRNRRKVGVGFKISNFNDLCKIVNKPIIAKAEGFGRFWGVEFVWQVSRDTCNNNK